MLVAVAMSIAELPKNQISGGKTTEDSRGATKTPAVRTKATMPETKNVRKGRLCVRSGARKVPVQLAPAADQRAAVPSARGQTIKNGVTSPQMRIAAPPTKPNTRAATGTLTRHKSFFTILPFAEVLCARSGLTMDVLPR